MRVTTEVEGDLATIRVEGELDRSNVDQVRDAALALLNEGAHHLVIDCAGVAFIDSVGLSAFAEAYRNADIAFGSVTVRNPTAMVLRLLQITGLDELLIIEEPGLRPHRSSRPG